MALRLEEIRALADRVAASHGLDVVDVEYLGGGGKHRTLRVFIEKNEPERTRLKERLIRWQARQEAAQGEEPQEGSGEAGAGEAADEEEAFLAGLPSVENLELLSGVTHEDCEIFSQDFGTVLDVEELVPGTEYLLEISSPGLDRKLSQPADYWRFSGSRVKLQTFEPVTGNRHWQGRIAEVRAESIVVELGDGKPARKAKSGSGGAALQSVEIALSNIEKAHLVPEF